MAHGLVLKLEEMLQRNLVSRKDYYEITSEENKVIQSWLIGSNQPKFCKVEFLRLMRKTLVFMFSHHGLREPQRKELLKGVTVYFNTFSNTLKNQMDFRKPIIEVIIDPWKNLSFSWDEFFQHKTSVYDKKVQSYFASEPEEVVMARVHAFMIQGKEDLAMTLAKCSYLFHSRIAKSLFVTDPQGNRVRPQSLILNTKNRRGIASMDWYLFILQRKNVLQAIVDELKQLTCHEGVQLVHRLRRQKKNQGFIFTILQVFIMQELLKPSKYCCTKKLFSLWCFMHKEKKSGYVEVNTAMRKMLAIYSPSSAHFYLFADALWEQFGSSFVPMYVELYVRGLTVDINHLEAVRHREDRENVTILECHIASMFSKLSTLFSDFHEGASRECMFSAFSLKPTKERLFILQSLTHSILSSENEMKATYSMNTSRECKCSIKCQGACKVIKDYCLDHPVLKKGISNVPFMLVKDLVTVLEGVRCIQFQYNLFDWHNNAIDLGDYLRDYNMLKSWDSDTEYASDESIKEEREEKVAQVCERPMQIPIKRKSSPNVCKEYVRDYTTHSNPENVYCKKIKLENEDVDERRNVQDIISKSLNPVSFGDGIEMNKAIENVIRLTLDRKRPDLLLPNNNFLNTALNRSNDGTQNINLGSIKKRVPENRVHPYSLNSPAKGTDLNSPECSSAKSGSEITNEYMQNSTSKSPISSKGAAVTHSTVESIISPVNPFKNLTPQGQVRQQVVLNQPFSVQTVKVPGMSHSKTTKAANFSSYQRTSMPISTYQHILNEMSSKNTPDGLNSQSRPVNPPSVPSQRGHLQLAHSSSFGFRNSRAPCKSPVSFTMTNPINLSQTNVSMGQQKAHASTSQSTVPQLEQYMTVSPMNDRVLNYKNSEIAYRDRTSVIQHTTHITERPVSQEKTEIKTLTSVSQPTLYVQKNIVPQKRPETEIPISAPQSTTMYAQKNPVPQKKLEVEIPISASKSTMYAQKNLVVQKRHEVEIPIMASQPIMSTQKNLVPKKRPTVEIPISAPQPTLYTQKYLVPQKRPEIGIPISVSQPTMYAPKNLVPQKRPEVEIPNSVSQPIMYAQKSIVPLKRHEVGNLIAASQLTMLARKTPVFQKRPEVENPISFSHYTIPVRNENPAPQKSPKVEIPISVPQYTIPVRKESPVLQKKSEIVIPVSESRHTMPVQENTQKGTEGENLISVYNPINQNISQQIPYATKKDLSNLPPFRVSVDRSISNELAISANLVIQRKSLQIGNSESVTSNCETIAIPGILASPSVIISPWEAQQKKHGSMLYKKTAISVASTSNEKKIYKYRPKVPQQLILKQDSYNIIESYNVNKDITAQAVHTISTSSQLKPIASLSSSMPNSNQTVEGKSISNIIMPSPSQPWYSAPYPKLTDCDNVNAIASTSLASNNPPTKYIQPNQQLPNVKSTTIYRKVHPTSYKPKTSNLSLNNNNATISSPQPSQPIKPQLLGTPTPLNITNDYSLTRDQTVTKIPASPSMQQIASPSTQQIASPSMQQIASPSCLNKQFLQDQHNRAPDIKSNYTASKIPIMFSAESNRQSCHTVPGNFPRVCCSPTETNPCQNCSLPKTDSNMTPCSGGQNTVGVLQQSSPSTPKATADVIQPSCNTNTNQLDENIMTRIINAGSNVNDSVIKCPLCLQLFHSADLEKHILSSHSNYLSSTSFNTTVTENNVIPLKVSTQDPLPDVVPEQDTYLKKDSFQNDLSHTKSSEDFGNQLSIPEDAKNLDYIDINAFSACMDLINNDKDLTRIVEVIDSLDQMDNNYLPFSDPNNFFSSNVCDDMQKTENIGLVDTALQNMIGEKDEINKYTTELDNTGCNVDKKDTSKNVFDFTSETTYKEKNSQIFNYGETFDYEEESAVKSPTKGAVTFSELAQMIKATITDDDNNNDLETFGTEKNNYFAEAQQPQASTFQNMKMDTVYDTGRPQIDINDIPKKIISPEPEKRKYQCKYCHLRFLSLSKHRCKVLTNLIKNNKFPPKVPQIAPEVSENVTKSTCLICKRILSSSRMKFHMLTKHQVAINKVPNLEQPNEVANSEQQHKMVSSELKILNSQELVVKNTFNDKINKNTAVPQTMGIDKSKNQVEIPCPVCGKRLLARSMKRHMQWKHNEQVTLSKQPQAMSDEQQYHGNEQNAQLSEKAKQNGSAPALQNQILSNPESNKLVDNFLIDPKLKSSVALPVRQNWAGTGPYRKSRERIECKCCGKSVTQGSLRKHMVSRNCDKKKVANQGELELVKSKDKISIQNDQQLRAAKLENLMSSETDETSSSDSKDQNIDVPQLPNISLAALSTLHEPDIDSSTCLSVSDAKRNSSYNIADASNLSVENGNLSNKTNVKFNFNAIEFSKLPQVNNVSISEAPHSLESVIEPEIKQEIITEPNKTILPLKPHTKTKKQYLEVYYCDFCPKKFYYKGNINRHCKKVHKTEFEQQKSDVVATDIIQVKNTVQKIIAEESKRMPSNSQTTKKQLTKYLNDKNINLQNSQMKSRSEENPKTCIPKHGKNLLKAVLTSNMTKSFQKQDPTKEHDTQCNVAGNTNSVPTYHQNETVLTHYQNEFSPNMLNYEQHNVLEMDFALATLNQSEGDQPPHEVLATQENLVTLVPVTNMFNTPVEQTEIGGCFENNLVNYDGKVFQVLGFNHNDSQHLNQENLTVHSSEISPVTEIISNISKYNFAGSSKIEKEKGADENSLKLPIPENEVNKDYESALQKANFDISQNSFLLVTPEYNLSSSIQKGFSSTSKLNSGLNPDEQCTNSYEEAIPNNCQTENMQIDIEGEMHKQDNICESGIEDLKCKLCGLLFNSLTLSKHLKDVHNVPVLKNQVLEQCSVHMEINTDDTERLSPPNLYLGIESASESIINNKNTKDFSEVSDKEEIQRNNVVSPVLANLENTSFHKELSEGLLEPDHKSQLSNHHTFEETSESLVQNNAPDLNSSMQLASESVLIDASEAMENDSKSSMQESNTLSNSKLPIDLKQPNSEVSIYIKDSSVFLDMSDKVESTKSPVLISPEQNFKDSDFASDNLAVNDPNKDTELLQLKQVNHLQKSENQTNSDVSEFNSELGQQQKLNQTNSDVTDSAFMDTSKGAETGLYDTCQLPEHSMQENNTDYNHSEGQIQEIAVSNNIEFSNQHAFEGTSESIVQNDVPDLNSSVRLTSESVLIFESKDEEKHDSKLSKQESNTLPHSKLPDLTQSNSEVSTCIKDSNVFLEMSSKDESIKSPVKECISSEQIFKDSDFLSDNLAVNDPNKDTEAEQLKYPKKSENQTNSDASEFNSELEQHKYPKSENQTNSDVSEFNFESEQHKSKSENQTISDAREFHSELEQHKFQKLNPTNSDASEFNSELEQHKLRKLNQTNSDASEFNSELEQRTFQKLNQTNSDASEFNSELEQHTFQKLNQTNSDVSEFNSKLEQHKFQKLNQTNSDISRSVFMDTSEGAETGLYDTYHSPEHSVQENDTDFKTSAGQNQEIEVSDNMEFSEQLSLQSSIFEFEMLSDSNHDSIESQPSGSKLESANSLPVMSSTVKSACDNIQSTSVQSGHLDVPRNISFDIDESLYTKKHLKPSTFQCKNNFRRHSFCDTKSFYHQLKSKSDTKHLFAGVNVQDDVEIKETKSSSLPNFQVALELLSSRATLNESKMIESVSSDGIKHLSIVKNPMLQPVVKIDFCSIVDGKCIQQLIKDIKGHSSNEITSNSIKEGSEASCDTSSNNSSGNMFVQSDSLQIPKHKTTLSKIERVRKKLSHSKLWFQKIKDYGRCKRETKSSKCFCCHKNVISSDKKQSNIVTYAKHADVLNFLKTHKQPVVKLRRIDENYVQCNKKPPIDAETCIKKAVVKLEKLDMPNGGFNTEFTTNWNSATNIESDKNSSSFLPNSNLQSKKCASGFNSVKSRKNISLTKQNFRFQRKKCVSKLTSVKSLKNSPLRMRNSKFQSKKYLSGFTGAKSQKNKNLHIKNSKFQSKKFIKVTSAKSHKNISLHMQKSKFQNKKYVNGVTSGAKLYKKHSLSMNNKKCMRNSINARPTRIHVQRLKFKYSNGFHLRSRSPNVCEVFEKQVNSPVLIDLTDSNDCDLESPKEKLQTVVLTETCLISTEQSSVPLVKKCFVVLKRISL